VLSSHKKNKEDILQPPHRRRRNNLFSAMGPLLTWTQHDRQRAGNQEMDPARRLNP